MPLHLQSCQTSFQLKQRASFSTLLAWHLAVGTLGAKRMPWGAGERALWSCSATMAQGARNDMSTVIYSNCPNNSQLHMTVWEMFCSIGWKCPQKSLGLLNPGVWSREGYTSRCERWLLFRVVIVQWLTLRIKAMEARHYFTSDLPWRAKNFTRECWKDSWDFSCLLANLKIRYY